MDDLGCSLSLPLSSSAIKDRFCCSAARLSCAASVEQVAKVARRAPHNAYGRINQTRRIRSKADLDYDSSKSSASKSLRCRRRRRRRQASGFENSAQKSL